MTRTSRAIHAGLCVAALVGTLAIAGALFGLDLAEDLGAKLRRRL